MNRQILINLIMLVTGAGLGFLVSKKILETKYSLIAQEEIESVKETFGRSSNKVERGIEDEGSNGEPIDDKKPKSSLEGTYTNGYNQAKRNYGLVVDEEYLEKKRTERESPPDDDPDDSDDPTQEDEMRKAEKESRDMTSVDKQKPYIIDDMEFAEEMQHYDKVTLYYYMLDDVLTDSNEEIIDDVEDTIGTEALSIYPKQVTSWVRNERIATDFEVVRLKESYQEAVLGIVDPNPDKSRIRREKKPHEVE